MLTVEDANGARIIGLTIRVPSGPGGPACASEHDGIVVFDSAGVEIRGTTVRGVQGPRSGMCGLRHDFAARRLIAGGRDGATR